MTLFLNRCVWNPTAGGLTDFVVASAFTGAYTPAQCLDPVVTDGGSYHYFAATADNTQHEEGDGVYSVATHTLTRATIRNSSSGGVKVNFSQAPIVTMGGPTSLEILPIQVNASTSPNTLTLQAPSVLSGTQNTAGQPFTINGSFATGVGEPGFITYNTGYVGYDSGKTLSSISQASPAVFITAGNHNLFAKQCILLQTTGTLPAPLAPLTQYIVDTASLTATTFEVATTLGGTPINTTSAGSGTHSYIPGGVVTSLFQTSLPSGPATYFFCTFAGGLVDGMVVQFQSTVSLPTGINANTNYFVIAPIAGSPGFEGFAVTSSQAGFPPIVATGGAGTLTFTVQTNIQNQPILSTGFTVGPNNLVGNDAAPFLALRQTWNTSLSGAVFAPLGEPVATLLSMTINNMRAPTQTTVFSQYNASATNLNFLSHQQANNSTGGSWQIGSGFSTTNTFIEFHNSNWPDTILGLIGNPIEFATQTSNSAGIIAVQLGYDNTNGIAAFYNPTPTSPTGIRAYNTTDNTTGAPTNFERIVADFVTTANVGTIGTQAGGSGTVRDFAIVKGTNTFLTSQTSTVAGLPAAGAGLTGARRFVTDSNATITAGIGAVVAGGGANIVPVFCDGTNWRIA